MRSVVFAALLFPICVSASSPPVVFHKTFGALTTTVVAPNVIEVTTTFNGATDLAKLRLNLSGVDFEAVANSSCASSTGETTQHCERL